MEYKIGDNVRSLRRPNAHICTIIQISPELGRGYFVLAPMTSRGFPSVDRNKWEYYHIKLICKLRRANKYPTLFTCHNCDCDNKILNAPLRRVSAYDNKYQCKRCKFIFEKS